MAYFKRQPAFQYDKIPCFQKNVKFFLINTRKNTVFSNLAHRFPNKAMPNHFRPAKNRKNGEFPQYIPPLETRLFFRYYRKVRVFKYTRFSRFASKEGITDHELLEVVNLLEEDQADANLGGDVYKVRIARQGEGKSGGHRVIVYFRNEHRTFFFVWFFKE